MVIEATQARKANGERVTNAVNRDGQVTVLGNEPLLKARRNTGGEPLLMALCKLGVSCAIEWTGDLSATPGWQFLNRVTLTGQSVVVPLTGLGLLAGMRSAYLRVRRE